MTDPLLCCMKMCREYQRGEDAALQKTYNKYRKKFKVEAAIIYSTYAWMLLRKKQVDQARQVLLDGKKATEDEILVEDADGMPLEVVVADNAGTFVDYLRPLEVRLADYARPVNDRAGKVSDLSAFADAYLDGFHRWYLPGARRRGLTLAACWRTPAGVGEGVTVTTALEVASWAAWEQARNAAVGDSDVHTWVARRRTLMRRGRRTFVTPVAEPPADPPPEPPADPGASG